MKHIRKDGSVVDGTPQEIADYHKLMAGGSRARAPKYHRASYSEDENRQIRQMVRDGKAPIQIARKLWSMKLSPHKRTVGAIIAQIQRLAK